MARRSFSLMLAWRYMNPRRALLSAVALISVMGVMFGVLVLVPFVWLAALQARRPAPTRPPHRRHLLWPCLVFAGLVVAGSLSWDHELRRLRARGDALDQRIVDATAVPGLVDTPLYHWSGAVTSILVQGRRPCWWLRAHEVRDEPEGIRLWPSQIALWFHRDGGGAHPFDLSALAPAPERPRCSRSRS